METREQIIERIEKMTKRMRRHALDMAFSSGTNAHLGGGLSIIEITATLFGAIMKFDPQNPGWEERDRFILSKGHGVLGYYPALAECGFFPVELLKTFQTNDSDLIAHPVMNMSLGIEFSNGSLGMGLSLGIGVALTGKMGNKDYSVYVVMGNGECNEGSVWEAAMAASHYKLNNLVALIDNNALQSDGQSSSVMNMGNLADKWKSFGWETREANGHDIGSLYDTLSIAPAYEKPLAIIANTAKGKGISFMEGNNEWHHNRLTQAQYDIAINEIGV